MPQSYEFTKNTMYLFQRTQENLASYYCREAFADALAGVERASRETRYFRFRDLENLCKAYCCPDESDEASKQAGEEAGKKLARDLLADHSLLDTIPTQNEVRQRLLKTFHTMYAEFPRTTDYMERLVRRLAPEYAEDPVRVAILKKFLIGAGETFRRYDITAILNWAAEGLSAAEKAALARLPAGEQRTRLVSRITDDIFVQKLPDSTTGQMSDPALLQWIAGRLANYQSRFQPTAQADALLGEDRAAFDAMTPEAGAELLQKKIGSCPRAGAVDALAALSSGALLAQVLLLQHLHAHALPCPSLDKLDLSPATRQQMHALLAEQNVPAASSDLVLVQQCADAAGRGAASPEALAQLLNGLEKDLRAQLKTIPRVTRTQEIGEMAAVYKQDKKDAQDLARKESAQFALLELCSDLASGSFRSNGKTKVALYYFAFMFGMNFTLDDHPDHDRDIEINLFQDYYCDNLLRALDPELGSSTALEKEPTGEGINYKSFVECIYLYFLYHTELHLTPGERIDAAEKLIDACTRKASAVKKKADDAGQDPPLLSQAEAGTLFYKDWRFQDLLELPYSKPNALVKFILEHYLVLDPDSIGLNRIRIASGESTAADLAADYLAELDNATSGYSLDAGDPDEKEAYAARLSDLNCLQYSFQWNLHDQLCAAFPGEEDAGFRRVVDALDVRVHSQAGRYSTAMRQLMVAVLHVLVRNSSATTPLRPDDIEARLDPDTADFLELERKKGTAADAAEDANASAMRVTVNNALKLLQTIGYDIQRQDALKCTLPKPELTALPLPAPSFPKQVIENAYAAGKDAAAKQAEDPETAFPAVPACLEERASAAFAEGLSGAPLSVLSPQEERRWEAARKKRQQQDLQAAQTAALQQLLERSGYRFQRVQLDNGHEFWGLRPAQKNVSQKQREKEAAAIRAYGYNVSVSDRFFLGQREYRAADLNSFLQKVDTRYIVQMPALSADISGILARRLLTRITRSELLALHFNSYVFLLDPETQRSFPSVYKNYSEATRELLAAARFQPLNTKNIFDMYLVCELYLYLLENNGCDALSASD